MEDLCERVLGLTTTSPKILCKRLLGVLNSSWSPWSPWNVSAKTLCWRHVKISSPGLLRDISRCFLWYLCNVWKNTFMNKEIQYIYIYIKRWYATSPPSPSRIYCTILHVKIHFVCEISSRCKGSLSVSLRDFIQRARLSSPLEYLFRRCWFKLANQIHTSQRFFHIKV